MARTPNQQPFNFRGLPLEIQTMIINEALAESDMTIANINAIQLNLLHTSSDIRAITQSAMVPQTFWLRYILCRCMLSVVDASNLTDFSVEGPKYAPYSRRAGPTLSLKACRCGTHQYEYGFLVPYQPRAFIQTTHRLGNTLWNPHIAELAITYSKGNSNSPLPCVVEAFELMAILIKKPITTLENCQDIVPSTLIGIPKGCPVTYETADCYIMQRILEFASDAIADSRYLEVIYLFCIAQVDLVDSWGNWPGRRTLRKTNTFNLMHTYLASCAIMALTELIQNRPEDIEAAHYGYFGLGHISKMALSAMRQFPYLDKVQRSEAIYDSAKLVYLLASVDQSRHLDLYVDEKQIMQSLSDIRAAVARGGENPSVFLGDKSIIDKYCRIFGARSPQEIDLECKEAPVQKFRGWMSHFHIWDSPAAQELYHSLVDELDRRV